MVSTEVEQFVPKKQNIKFADVVDIGEWLQLRDKHIVKTRKKSWDYGFFLLLFLFLKEKEDKPHNKETIKFADVVDIGEWFKSRDKHIVKTRKRSWDYGFFLLLFLFLKEKEDKPFGNK